MIINSLIYILAVLGANYTATWFIPFPIYGQAAIGTFIFGVTFTQRDRLHQYGRRYVYRAIAVAAGTNVLMSAVLGVPLRIIAASFLAIVLAETADTEIYQRLISKSWLIRVAGSNAVSVPLDTVLFTLIAFWGVAAFPPAVIASILVGDTIVKYAIGALVALYRGKQAEQWQNSSD
ncbi:MAG TPA: VUT family protein [Coleofasciculaceae cyanobacterium]